VTALTNVKARIDAMEQAYEYFLAYAAQGVSGDGAAKAGPQLRDFLSRAVTALDGLAEAVRAAVVEGADIGRGGWDDMLVVLDRDASSALAAVRLVAAQPSVSSQLVDNLNANIHLRAVLTDLFLVDDLLG
jgi:cellulose synthase/poly-beta-1,6-N-acetylglucosamine synthase-like glycosyltransferase